MAVFPEGRAAIFCDLRRCKAILSIRTGGFGSLKKHGERPAVLLRAGMISLFYAVFLEQSIDLAVRVDDL